MFTRSLSRIWRLCKQIRGNSWTVKLEWLESGRSAIRACWMSSHGKRFPGEDERKFKEVLRGPYAYWKKAEQH